MTVSSQETINTEVCLIPIEIIPKDWLEDIYNIYDKSLTIKFNREHFYKHGLIDLIPLKKESRIKLRIYQFVCCINEIYENIHIIFSDFKILSYQPNYFPCSPYRRFYLLIRMFFYEFFRIKENHRNFIKSLVKEQCLSTEKGTHYNSALYNLIKETIQIRNKLVHNDVNWTEEHCDLSLLFLAEESGHQLIKKDTMKGMTYKDLLPELVEYYLRIFSDQVKLTEKFFEQEIQEIPDSINNKLQAN